MLCCFDAPVEGPKVPRTGDVSAAGLPFEAAGRADSKKPITRAVPIPGKTTLFRGI